MEQISMKSDVKMWLKKDGEKFLKSIGIREGQVILDFGCGEGHYTIPSAKVVGEKGKIYAIDRDEEALDELVQLIKKNNIKNIEVIKKESNITLENNSIDFILCYDVIHYLKNRKIIYNEFYRVLKPRGIFSLYPKHHKNDYPLMELAHMELRDIIKEVEETGLSLRDEIFKTLIHDDYYNDGYILNFRKD
jgi:ubiquinone/menaquinone biosynthesis C-methylase UbiE